MSESIHFPKCDGCGADIFWVRTAAGKPMPLDTKKRTIMIPESWTKGDAGDVKDAKWIMVSGYQSHFATCPRADNFRKPKGDNNAPDQNG